MYHTGNAPNRHDIHKKTTRPIPFMSAVTPSVDFAHVRARLDLPRPLFFSFAATRECTREIKVKFYSRKSRYAKYEGFPRLINPNAESRI